MRNSRIYIFLVPFFISCVGFTKVPEILKENKIRQKPDSVRFHFIGWEYYVQHRESLKNHIIQSGLKEDNKSHFLLEIRLIEKDRYYFSYKFLNILAFIYTGGLFPIYDGINHRIEFRLYKDIKEESICSFRISNHQFTGVLMLPLTPFFYPSATQRNLFKEAFDLYKKKCSIN